MWSFAFSEVERSQTFDIYESFFSVLTSDDELQGGDVLEIFFLVPFALAIVDL